jgi:hypothetical protein
MRGAHDGFIYGYKLQYNIYLALIFVPIAIIVTDRLNFFFPWRPYRWIYIVRVYKL